MGSDHELGVHGPMVAVEVAYQVSNVFTYPKKKTILEVLLYLSICDSPRALQPDLIKGPL